MNNIQRERTANRQQLFNLNFYFRRIPLHNLLLLLLY